MIRSHKWLFAPLALALAACLSLSARADQAQAQKADAPNRAGDQDTVKGKVQSVSADHNQIVVRDENNHDMTFQVARDAKVRVNDKDAQAADLKEGDEVAITFRRVARNVCSAQGDQAGEFAVGRVQRVGADNNQLVLKGHDGQERTFQVAQNARIRCNDKEGKLSDLKEGDHAVVAYAKQGDQLAAREIMCEQEGRGAGLAAGQVERMSADHNQIVLKDQAGHEHTFQLGQDAQVRINDKEGKAADLQQGSQAVVAYWREAAEVNGRRGDK
jgi:Cu/Ag efflux protein CusF